MSDIDTPLALPGDALREGVVQTLRDALGDALIDSLVKPNDDVWVWLRGARTVVACNLSEDEVEVADVGPGAIRICTQRARDNEHVDGTLRLAPWEAAIIWREA